MEFSQVKQLLETRREVVELFLRGRLEIVAGTDAAFETWRQKIPAAWAEALAAPVNTEDTLRALWAEAGAEGGGFVSRLVARVAGVALGVVSNAPDQPRLLYLVRNGTDQQTSFFVWVAGLPATPEQVRAAQSRLAWRLPASYVRFAAVHNGFLVDGFEAVGPTALDKLVRLSDVLGAGTGELGYAPDDLLWFSGDGSGNAQCYFRAMPVPDGDWLTVDWDHETRHLSQPISFWGYLEDLVLREHGT
jgi:hypothetical protein